LGSPFYRKTVVEKYPDSHKAIANLLKNRLHLGAKQGTGESDYTPPSPHYPHIYPWDLCFAVIMAARHGEEWLQRGRTEQLTLFKGQLPNGMIPNTQFAEKGRKRDPERILALEKDAKSSNYMQPPVQALSTREIYEASYEEDPYEADKFLLEVYPKLKKSYSYIETHRSNSPENKLMGVIHPHETGLDSLPIFDFIKRHRLKRNGIDTPNYVDKLNIPIDYFSIIWHGMKLKKAGGDISKQREVFWVNNVMMNCIYVDNLRETAKLAQHAWQPQDALHFSKLASEVEEQILTRMWEPLARDGKGAFYDLDSLEQPINEITVSNLFPLTLSNLHEEQLESLLTLMDESFNTPYPLPSVATDSENYDPHNREKDRLWRGPTWINTNWYIVERGLKMQMARPEISKELKTRCYWWAEKISRKSKELVDTHGAYEHYNPLTGKPQRKRAKNFAWSNLAYFMPNLVHLKNHLEEDEFFEEAA
jgi:hypothetical protein